MSAADITTTVSIDTKSEFEEQVRTTGVVVDGAMHHTEGEGRGTRYFIGTDNVPKGDVMSAFDGAGEYEVPAPGNEHGDIECRHCGKVLGYLTGSHMKSHEDGPQTVDEYREFVAAEDDIDPEDVPLCTDDMMETYRSAGDLGDEVREELAERNRQRWEEGEYDHLRSNDDEDEEDEADEEAVPA